MRPQVEIELEIPDLLWGVLVLCAIYCEPACCGENAFQLFPENMQGWAEQATPEEIDEVKRDIDWLIAEVTRLGPTAGLKDFAGDDPQGPRAWLEDVRECVQEATSPAVRLPNGSRIVRRVTAHVRVLSAGETHMGEEFPPVPLSSGRVEVLLPDRPLTIQMLLDDDELQPGQEGPATFRFPLPARIQPLLAIGATLDLDHHRGSKTAHARVTGLLE